MEIPAISVRIKITLLIIALGGLVLLLYVRFARTPGTSTSVGTLTQAETPGRVESKVHIRKTPPPKVLMTLDKGQLSWTLKMPKLLSEAGEPLAVAEIPAHRGKTTSIAMLDNVTGRTRILMRPEPPPFFSLKKELGVRGGFGTGGLVIGEVYLRPLQINPRDRGSLDVEIRGYIHQTAAGGTELGGAVLLDYRF